MGYNFIDVSEEHKYPPSYLPEDGCAIYQNDALYSQSRRLKISRVLWRVSLAIKFSNHYGWKWAQMPVEHFPTTRTALTSFYDTRWFFPMLLDRSGTSILKNYPAYFSQILITCVTMSVFRWHMPSLAVTPNIKSPLRVIHGKRCWNSRNCPSPEHQSPDEA